jgi:hypothetical protein
MNLKLKRKFRVNEISQKNDILRNSAKFCRHFAKIRLAKFRIHPSFMRIDFTSISVRSVFFWIVQEGRD